MSYLKMALAALQSTTGVDEAGTQRFGFTSQEPNLTPTNEAPQASPRERILTCGDCPRHEHDRINPPEGWGRCTLKKRGCYGLRPACSESPRDTWDG